MLFFYLKLAFKILKSKPYRKYIFRFALVMFKGRFDQGKVRIFGNNFFYNDSLSFLIMFEEIFIREVYRFDSTNAKPLVLDCGANIGLSVLYFSKLYPNVKIWAFEPDPSIYSVLKKNCETFSIQNLQLIQKAIWTEVTTLDFQTDNAAGGTVLVNDKNTKLTVETTSLTPYLNNSIDFLKIDIEGAENEIFEGITPQLNNVKNLFVEWHSFSEQSQNLSMILKNLQDIGFRYYLENNGVYSQRPFVLRNTIHTMDNCVNIYAYK